MAGRASNELLLALGGAVRAHRVAHGLTQERLAEAAGLHTTYISDVERGHRNIGVINLDRLARALSVDLSSLIHDAETRRSEDP